MTMLRMAACRWRACVSNNDELRGISRLIVEAIEGVTDIVETQHRTISAVAPPIGRGRGERTGGISGLVYRSIRGINRGVGVTLDVALRRLPAVPALTRTSGKADSLIAILNGVLGDHLAAQANPLAINMQFRRDGKALPTDKTALRERLPDVGDRLLVLVHGLCMDDRGWTRDGHDHGQALARDRGHTPVYLRYNSGRHIADNGREFAEQLDRLVDAWPVPIREIVLLGHSMGGLVSRSACHWAEQHGQSWRSRLSALICLGTPHLGAPLERAGHWVSSVAALSPYATPFTRLAAIRSVGIRDLRDGSILPAAMTNDDAQPHRRAHRLEPLPEDVRCLLIAASRQKSSGSGARRPIGDGLVSVNSALGWHRDPSKRFDLVPEARQTCHATNHLGLLSSKDVYHRLRQWLATKR